MEKNRQKLGKNFRKMKNFPDSGYCFFCTALSQKSLFFHYPLIIGNAVQKFLMASRIKENNEKKYDLGHVAVQK